MRVPIDNESLMFFRLRWSFDPIPQKDIDEYTNKKAPKAITAADLTRLLTDESLRAAAREVAAEIAAMPAPATVVPELEKLVSG